MKGRLNIWLLLAAIMIQVSLPNCLRSQENGHSFLSSSSAVRVFRHHGKEGRRRAELVLEYPKREKEPASKVGHPDADTLHPNVDPPFFFLSLFPFGLLPFVAEGMPNLPFFSLFIVPLLARVFRKEKFRQAWRLNRQASPQHKWRLGLTENLPSLPTWLKFCTFLYYRVVLSSILFHHLPRRGGEGQNG